MSNNDAFQQIVPNGIRNYKGNPNLKAANVDFIFTREQIEERIRCMKDPIYFIQKYMKIVHVDRGLVPFDLYDFQKELLTSYIENRFTIAKLPRQVGKSTVTIAYILWTVLFGPMQNIAILANKASTSRDILAKLQLAYEFIPLWMQQGIVSWNKGSIELENGSKVIAAATASSAARGSTYNVIFLDEFAFVPKNIAEEFITSVYPTVSSGKTTKVIMVSTPNGMNLFYKYWTDAVNGRNLYKPIEAHWSVVPGRDDAWAADQVKQLGQEKFNQEFGCVSGETLIETENGIRRIEDEFNDSKRIFLVYKITRSDGKIYIGTTIKDRLKNRLSQHKNSSRFKNYDFKFEILEESNCKDYIYKKEEYYIKHFDSYNNGLNESINGKGNHLSDNFTTLNYTYSKESKLKMSISAQKRVERIGAPFTNKKHTKKTKLKLSKIRKGKIHSTKTSNKIYDELREKFEMEKPFIEKYKSKNGKLISKERIFAKQVCKKYNLSTNHIVNILNKKTLR
jgi:predicted GIY-YIG superfamily endonuclease